MTLAPELPAALDVITACVRAGTLVSCGHSNANAAQAHAAFDHGARLVTHLFDAMRPFTHRDPGIVGAALTRVQLGGEPTTGAADAAGRSYVDYRPPPADPNDLPAMLADSLAGERAAIRFYRALFDKTRDIDPVTAEIARQALADEIGDEDDLERLQTGWPD